NLLVKYRFVCHVCLGDVPSPKGGRPRPYEGCFERSSVEKRALLASISCRRSICALQSPGVHTSKYSPCPATTSSPLGMPRKARKFCGTRIRPTLSGST